MSERHPFSELTKDFPAERRRRIEAMKRELVAQSKPSEGPASQ